MRDFGLLKETGVAVPMGTSHRKAPRLDSGLGPSHHRVPPSVTQLTKVTASINQNNSF